MKYKKYFGDYWKVYLMRFKDRQSGQFKALKPGWTRFMNADDRITFNHECFIAGKEPDSFLNHYDVDCIWSLPVHSTRERDKLEKLMLEFFGDKLELGINTSGKNEVRSYNQKLVNTWLNKPKQRIKKWAES